jgi:amino acid adenylation domain-containing protein
VIPDPTKELATFSPEQRALFAALLNRTDVDVTGVPLTRWAGPGEPPLSFAQERLWYLHQLTQMNPTYNEPAVFRLRGPLDPTLLARSFAAVVQRHDILRMYCVERGAEVMQAVSGSLPVDIDPVDLCHLSEPEREARALEWFRGEVLVPFDLAAPPLWRLRLFRIGENDWIFGLVVHLIVADGWSLRTLARELAQHYRAFANGEILKLPDLPVQYGDFACWQKRLYREYLLEGQLDYWQRRLAGAPELQDLPLDRPRPQQMAFRGRSHEFAFGHVLSNGVKALGAKLGTTPFVTLLSALDVLLHRYSGLDDIVIGTQVSNRSRRALENLIGPFGNNLVMRCDCAGNPTFSAVVSQVSDAMIAALEHQDVPFDKVVEALGPKRDLGHYPLFQVEFMLHQDDMSANLDLPGIQVANVPIETGTARFDIDFTLVDDRDSIRGSIRYNSDLFDHTTILRLSQHYCALLEAVIADPQLPIDTISLSGVAESDLFLTAWNATAADYPRDACAHQLFERQAAATPDAVAVIDRDNAVSFFALNSRADRLAGRLAALGVGPGAIVALCMDRTPDLIVALLGIWKAGGAVLPLDPAFPRQRLVRILDQAGAVATISQSSVAAALSPHGGEILLLDSDWERDQPNVALAPPKRANAAEIAYIIYTSGSTGTPKGVAVAHRSLVNALTGLARVIDIAPSDRMLAVTTLSFDIAFAELLLPLMTGAAVVLADRATATDGVALRQKLEDTAVTLMQATPSTWRLLLAAGWPGKRGLKALCGGETLDPALAAELLLRADAVWNLYGPTEATIWSTCHRVTSATGPIPIGRPLANTRVYVLDRLGQPVPIGGKGEICIGGDGVAQGYLGAPELTTERFVPDLFAKTEGARMYRTGDIGRFNDDGTLQFLGRRDQQVKLRGFRVELGEIESVLRENPEVLDAAVARREYSPGDVRLVAYVVRRAGAAATGSELRRFLRERLPEYMLPQLFVDVEALPRHTNGKIDRAALPDPFGGTGATAAAFVAPRNPGEQLIATIWRELLGVERIGAHDNFFDLGGHSLLVVHAIARIEEATGVRLSFRDVVTASLQNLAAIIGAKAVTEDANGTHFSWHEGRISLPGSRT